jgi:hypothetical protein
VPDIGPGLIVFLAALFFAVIGLTLFGVAICRGALSERRRSEGR